VQREAATHGLLQFVLKCARRIDPGPQRQSEIEPCLSIQSVTAMKRQGKRTSETVVAACHCSRRSRVNKAT
jgi:hypothetical protein